MPTDVIFSSICAVVKSFGHGRTPITEPKCDEKRCSEGHAAHEYTGEDVNKRAEEAAVLPLVEEVGQAVDLCRRDHKHDNAHKDCEIAVGLQNTVIDYLINFDSPRGNLDWNIWINLIFSPDSPREEQTDHHSLSILHW